VNSFASGDSLVASIEIPDMKRLAGIFSGWLLAFSLQGEVTMEKVNFGGWPNSIRLSNGAVELVATTDVGPRILRLALPGGENVFKIWPEQAGTKGGDQWKIYGGHRFWHAPEDKVRTYQPDNDPVEVVWKDGVLKLVQKTEPKTGLQKEMEITMHPKEARVEVRHRLRNQSRETVEAAPWALTVMQGPGRAIIPQEPPSKDLLPVRPMVMWGYTDMRDPRWTWGTKYIQLLSDPANKKPQKVGVRNSPGWAAFQGKTALFFKRIPFNPTATYPDFGSNTELYTNGDMLEVESLGPLTKLAAGAAVEHVEVWFLLKYQVGTEEEVMADKLTPLILNLK
jgi:predicted DNA-binding antitoxin AbrB/MazE fold protein